MTIRFFFCWDFEWKGNLPEKNSSSSEQEDEQQKRVFSDENDLFQMECYDPNIEPNENFIALLSAPNDSKTE